LFSAAPRGEDLKENKQPPRWMLATPEAIANRAVRAIYRNQGLVVVQPYARLTYLLKRFAPRLLDLGNRVRRRKQGPDKHRVASPNEKRQAA
jgi:hypothetical protein